MKLKNPKLYVNDTELVYEIILSKGKGMLTKKAEDMFLKIATNFMYNFFYYDNDYRDDCYQQGVESMFKNWRKFDEKKYIKALPYISELFKRGSAFGFNELIGRKKGVKLEFISINELI